MTGCRYLFYYGKSMNTITTQTHIHTRLTALCPGLLG